MTTLCEALESARQHQQAGRFKIAEQIYRQILAADPEQPDTLHLLGVLAFQMGQHALAVEHISRAIALRGTEATFHNNLSAVLKELGHLEHAGAECRHALELRPDYAKAHNNLGTILQAQGKFDDAVASLRRALVLQPDNVVALNNLGGVLKDLGQVDEAVANFRQALALRPDYSPAYRSLLYSLWFSPSFDSAKIYDEHCRWQKHWAEPLAREIRVPTNDPSPNRRLRIGYVGSDFREHCQSLFTIPLFEAHDREQFEIACYSDVNHPDDYTARNQACVDQWRNISSLSDEQVAQVIRQDQIDILVDLTMHMERGRLLVFARKPAPVQACWLAYPGTTGLTTIDYRLTDPYLDPPSADDSYYSEQSLRLPDSFWCYDPLTNAPLVNSLPALTNGYITFGCLNNFCKLNDATLQLWARVLKRVARSRLILLAPEGSGRERVLQILAESGVSAEQITFVGRQPRLNYLELYHYIDIGLDTLPYNGHTTSLDSFWMGVPVVTLVGTTVVGRAGLSQLHNLALPDLIAHSPKHFVEIAAKLADDSARLSQLRAMLRAKMEQSPLMDPSRFARSIEAAYRSIWRKWCAKPHLLPSPRYSGEKGWG
jgi:predicted O-linked N-acetylglucosamine transferase (SPINDLY family)